MSLPYALEKSVTISAVLRACALTHSVFTTLVRSAPSTGTQQTKADKSPVTIADYAAQSLLASVILRAFPSDKIVGEESSDALRGDANRSMRETVCKLVRDAAASPVREDLGEKPEWVAEDRTEEAILQAIDQGNYQGGNTGRHWTIDPIDGTKGFLRGEQYAVCVSLIVDSAVQVAVMGCPNLPVKSSEPDGEKGCLFVAVRGQGAEQRNISSPHLAVPLKTPIHGLPELTVLESVDPGHSSHGFNERVRELIGTKVSPVRMDSQAKYCSLARDGGVYLRMPVRGLGYREKIWDHAPGVLLLEESGAAAVSSRGLPLNFGLGRDLGENFGVVAAEKTVLPSVLDAVQKAWKEEEEKAKV